MIPWIRRATLATVVWLVTGAGAQTSQEQPAAETRPSSETATARCVLRVRYFRGDVPLDRKSFSALVNSDAVLGAAVRCVPGLEQAAPGRDVSAALSELNELSQIEGHTSVTTALLELSVRVWQNVPDAETKAANLLAAVSSRLEQGLGARNDAALRQRREAVDRAAEQVTQAQMELGKVQGPQQTLYAEAGQTELSRANILADLQATERDEQQAEMKLVELHARQNAIAEQIARIGKEVATRTQDDPVAVELQKVVALREKALEKAQELRKKGVAPEQDVNDAEEHLALARAELAKQREAASQSAGGNLLADLNKEVVTLAVDIAEAEARREYLHKRLEQARDRKLLELADRYEREVAPQLSAAEQTLRDALAQQVQAEERLAQYCPVTVTVLGETPGQ
jgi:hypothetical protein